MQILYTMTKNSYTHIHSYKLMITNNEYLFNIIIDKPFEKMNFMERRTPLF